MEPSERTSRRCRGDDGAIIVEAALILPILMAMLAGVVDVGVGFRDRLTMQGAVRTAGRVGAASQNSPNADRSILTALNASISKAQNFVVDRVVIFYSQPVVSSSTPASITTACATTAPSGATGSGVNTGASHCNIYSLSQMQQAAAGTGSFTSSVGTCGTNWDRFWCPPDPSTTNGVGRKVLLLDNGGLGPDYLGVYVVATYTPFTRIFRSSVTMIDQVVVRLEPLQ